ncbi:MAG: segregation/condensation protein A [Deltaproteobacteria bacterium]|nr:segregation/condensation protein A [Deltaproteobacteria bacterium]
MSKRLSKKGKPDEHLPPVPEHPLPEGVVRAGTDEYWVEARGTFETNDVRGYIPSPESEQLLVDLPLFEGPFDLLLHLIGKESIDIFDIPIARITEQYLAVLENMAALDLDIAGEFLVMASSLAHIKSKMLLPKVKEEEDEEDPRAALVRRLLQYKKFQRAAIAFEGMHWLGRDMYRRPPGARSFDEQEAPARPKEAELQAVDTLELIRMLHRMLKKSKRRVVHEVILERLNVGARINDLVDFAKERDHFTLRDIVGRFGGYSKQNIIVTLLAILEMTKLKLLKVAQPTNEAGHDGGDIYVTPVSENLDAVEDFSIVDDYAV